VRCLRAYRFPYDNPNWFANVGFVTLCLFSTGFVPIIGQLIAIGYLFDVVEAMHRQGDDHSYPDFQWDRFVPYLARGGMVFLVQILLSMPLMAFMMAGLVGVMITAGVTSSDEPNPVMIGVLLGIWLLVSCLAGVLTNLTLVPLTLRVGLSQDLASAFSWSFVKDFIARVWRPTLLAGIFLFFSQFVVTLVGFAMCCIGFYVVMALPVFAQYHLYFQLYELYLERGGTPIPLRNTSPRIRDEGGDWDGGEIVAIQRPPSSG
jgi:Protein of unknown function (DUF4013)